jgi:hypothetical protein
MLKNYIKLKKKQLIYKFHHKHNYKIQLLLTKSQDKDKKFKIKMNKHLIIHKINKLKKKEKNYF